MCFSLVSMLDFMGQNLTPLKSRLSKLQSWHQNFSCLVGPNEHFYTRCLLSARTSHGTTFAPRLSIKVSLKFLSLQASSLSLRFQPASPCLLFSKMNSRQENRSKLSFTARIITKYSLERFISICREKLSKGFLKFCKLISNLILGQIIVSNLTNVHKLNSRINYARLH